ncbi:MAG: DUF1501 domain-containing protein [Phycisphaerales bacterium]|nr:DUF1501 domain-containing protein [Phycisphaerales bacterium]
MHDHTSPLLASTRRQFFRDCGIGLGSIALGAMLAEATPGLAHGAELAAHPMAPRAPHFPPRVRSVIFLFMNGAPSQLDLFDHKPRLAELDGQACPEAYTKGEQFAFIRGTPRLLGSPYRFARHGACGTEVSELLPHTASIVDDLAVVRSMKTDAFNHAPAELFMNTGLARIGRPSMGSWLTYGLGSECSDLPGFVVLLSGGGQPSGGCSCWSSGFLPTVYQGVALRSQGDPVLFVGDPDGIDRSTRRGMLDALARLNRRHLDVVGDPEVATRIEQYEMAYRMQSSVPELMDLAGESKETLELYGTDPAEPSFARNCLLARRLVERGVRFVQLYHRGWDSHGTSPGDDIVTSLRQRCVETDQACAALVKDLKRRGLLDSTLVVWGGEFGRTPMNEARNGSTFLGRDHHPAAFTMWLAGGGVRAGSVYGATDDIGYSIASDPVHVHDLHATILHLMGIDHTRLTFRHQGRDFRLTDVHGEVVRGLLA